MTENVKSVWLVDDKNNKVAPYVTTDQILTETGESFDLGDVKDRLTKLETKTTQLEAKFGGCWIEFTDEEGNPTDEPYIHWIATVKG